MSIQLTYIDDNTRDLADFEAACLSFMPRLTISLFTDPEQARQQILQNPPDILVLDIEMKTVSGLQLAEQWATEPFMIVFLTSYSSYALRAFQLFALHYIVKPVTPADIEEIIRRYHRLQPHPDAPGTQAEQLDTLRQCLRNPQKPVEQIFINSNGKTHVLPLATLLYLEANGPYTWFYTLEGKTIISSQPIKIYDHLLSGHSPLIRVHRSFMVNKKYVRGIVHKGHQWQIEMSNGSLLDVSRLKKDWVMAELGR
jgi:two-component system, LytTR family, response regulator